MSMSRLSAATRQAAPLLLLIALALLAQRQVLSLELTGADAPLLLSASKWGDFAIPPAISGPALGDPTLGINFYRPLTALTYGLNLHTTGLDPLTTQTVDELICEAEEKFGVTSIVISHDMASVFRIADCITFLHFGEVKASGTPAELLRTLNPATLSFIRASGVSTEIIERRQ